MKRIILIALIGLFLASCNNEQKEVVVTKLTATQKKQEEVNLIETSRKWAKFKTIEEYLSYVGEGALMMAPDKGTIRGQKSIATAIKEFQTIPGFSVAWEPKEAFVSENGDLGYLVDSLLVTFDGEDGKPVKLFEKGISIWKKDSKGEWKMAVDIWNVDPTTTSL